MARIVCLIAVALCIAVNGENVGQSKAAGIGQFPYHASLRADGKHFCSGAVVSDNWVVTARSCVADRNAEDIKIFVGSIEKNASGYAQAVEKIVVHELYNADVNKHKYDIALVKTDDVILFYDDLPLVPVNRRWIRGQEFARVIGYGEEMAEINFNYFLQSDNHLRITYMSTLDAYECSDRFKMGKSLVDSTTLCADLTSTIAYDLGSPMIIDEKLVGVAMPHVQIKSTIAPLPQRFTRVSLYADWIKAVTGEDE